ncbi:MAG: NAD-dependent epimerase/dehydratase family protein [Opitutae bacterium]|nr:NAD-dependent epimerase/dehydratase family protein [Opitutae bacterium]
MNVPVFITGASGFIGGKLAERLLAAGREVRVLARRPLPELEKLGARIVRGDLDDTAALARGMDGAGTVFHVAGRVGVWGPAEEFFHMNVAGTRRVVAACRAAHVPRLVYTSSPSVVFNGGNLAGVDESAPLCTQAPSAYPTSKAAAERLVAAANDATLATVSLRPHLVWGPGDRNIIPRVLKLARSGRLKIIGEGRNLVDCTHITNVVDAHLQAEHALAHAGTPPALRPTCNLIGYKTTLLPLGENGKCNLLGYTANEAGDVRGKAYFITNGEPVVMWDWINEILRGLGEPLVTKHVSLATAYRAAGVLEFFWRVLPLKGEPPTTRFVVKELATDHWFKIAAARRDLGYAPRVTMAAGTAELVAHLKRSE